MERKERGKEKPSTPTGNRKEKKKEENEHRGAEGRPKGKKLNLIAILKLPTGLSNARTPHRREKNPRMQGYRDCWEEEKETLINKYWEKNHRYEGGKLHRQELGQNF